MNRRQRRERIIRWFNSRTLDRHITDLLNHRGLAAFTDEAIDELAQSMWKDWQRIQRMNASNRALAAQRAAS